MYPKDYKSGDDEEYCGCTFGKSCDYHTQLQEQTSRIAREACIENGINPDAEVNEELAEILFLITGCNSLSQNQKDAIERIIFPL